jgi:nitrate reductase beta subunit
MLYDADRIEQAASTPNEQDLYEAQLGIFLDPHDPEVIAAARREGIPEDWLEAARRSPVYKMAIDWRVAFPLHPEFRTLPMVWYCPPLSPIQSAAEAGKIGYNGEIPDVASLRIPVRYLANLLTAGAEAPVTRALERMLVMRAFMRSRHVDGVENTAVLERVGLDVDTVEDMYHYMAIANYEDRFVIPTNKREYAHSIHDGISERGGCGFTFGGGCHAGGAGADIFGGQPTTARKFFPIRVEKPTGPAKE